MSIIHRGAEEGRPPGSPSASGICGVALQGTGIWAAGTGCGLGRVQRRTGGRQNTREQQFCSENPISQGQEGLDWTEQGHSVQTGNSLHRAGTGIQQMFPGTFLGQIPAGQIPGVVSQELPHRETPSCGTERRMQFSLLSGKIIPLSFSKRKQKS